MGEERKQVVPESLRGILPGTMSGVAKMVVGHPFDTLKVRMQTEGSSGRFQGMGHCIRETLRTEGLRGFYKGATPPLIGWGLIDSVLIGTYTWARAALKSSRPYAEGGEPYAFVFAAGTLAGVVSTAIVTPIEQVKARLQTQYADPSSVRYKGPVDCVRQLVRNNRWSQSGFGLYKGFWGTLMFRSCAGVYFVTYEHCRRTLPLALGVPDVVATFCAGGLAATALWLVAFQFDTVKNKMAAQPDTPDRPYPTVRSAFVKTYQAEGLRGFYRGFLPCMLRSFPTNGAAFLAIEATQRWLP
jgi:solute carrier family 25 carnitine/acylcarnitine transporter 20/29